MREYIRKNKLTIYVFFVGVLCLITGGALAFFNASFRGVKEQTLNIGENLTFTYNETGSALALDNNDIMSNDKGKAKTSYFDFNIKLKADTKKTVKYNIYLTKSTTSTLDNSKLKIYLTDQSNNVIKDVTSVQSLQIFSKYANSYLLYQKEITSTNNTEATDYYRLRVWIDDSLGTSITENNGVHTIEKPNFSYKFTVNVDVGDNDSSTERLLTEAILGKNNSNVITTVPDLTDSYEGTNDISGLYVSTDTDDGSPTYYFRGNNGCQKVKMTEEICTLLGGTEYSLNTKCSEGANILYYTKDLSPDKCVAYGGEYAENVINNHVSFAGNDWLIVRINEDGSIRLVSKSNYGTSRFAFNTSYSSYTNMYYSDSSLKQIIDYAYSHMLSSYDSKIATSKFCEAFRVSSSDPFKTAGSVTATLYSSYTPTFKCETDANGKGVVSAKMAMLSYDEVVFSGINYTISGAYLGVAQSWWTISPNGFPNGGAYVWAFDDGDESGLVGFIRVDLTPYVRPVISLNADTMVTGSGTESDPYVVK